MKNSFFVLLLLSLFATATRGQSQFVVDSSAQIVKAHIHYLASDALMGRNTPSAGLDSAAGYIARQFAKWKIKPAGGNYLHSIGLYQQHLGEGNSMVVAVGDKSVQLPLKDGFIPFGFSASGRVEAPLVFAGYGVVDSVRGIDSYQGLDVHGKLVVVLSDTPPVMQKDDVKMSEEEKMLAAARKGAVGMVLVTGPAHRLILKPRGYTWPSLSKIIPNNLLPFEIGRDVHKDIPAVHAGEPFIEALWGSADALKNIQLKLDEGVMPSAFPLPVAAASLQINIVKDELSANNVIGCIEGSDQDLKNEFVIIGGHYDHLGAGPDKGDGSDCIYNGADDNASGTAGVLEVARLFSVQPEPPRRSVVFMLFAGEERGLLGSQAYVQQPVFPLKSTVAMINLDMISRNGDSLFLEGAASCPELSAMVVEHNKQTGLNLILDHNGLTGGSDHASFAGHNIPFLFFISGLHADYHKVTDNPDRSDAPKAARVARLAFLTAWQIANQQQYYSIKK
ncbi:MAG: M28 family peptidase [Bacteroidales bacterium]|nr:M28 family peptidase [Bacteroidales bacterium]MDD3664640.1 M28 family peptidase [Bacteroidales bacterium]